MCKSTYLNMQTHAFFFYYSLPALPSQPSDLPAPPK